MTVVLSTSVDLEAACQRAAAAGLPQLALFRGAADGRHTLAIISKADVAWPARVSKHLGPSIVVIGDDPYPNGHSIGPGGWTCARRAKDWARFVFVHGTGGAIDHYRAASFAASVHRRLLIVETDSAHIAEWADHFGGNVLRFQPPAGRVHPSPTEEVVH